MLNLHSICGSRENPSLFFDLSMHVGTALAVGLYFRKKFLYLALSFVAIIVKRDPAQGAFAANFFMSTLCSVFVVLALQHTAESLGRTPTLIAFNLAFFGLLMGAVDHFKGSKKSLSLQNTFSAKHSVLIGLFQAVSIFPGVSRSGITLTACRLLGLDREQAAHYSFLLSFPLIIGGFVYKLLDRRMAVPFLWTECLTGMAVSFIVGLLSIHFFLKIITSAGLWPFVFYRILLAIVIVVFI